MSALGVRGRRLLASLEAQDPALARETNPMREVALTAARTADRVDRLEGVAAEVEPWVTTDKGALVTHPALVEVRQQSALLARLVAALRLPDAATGKRPQVRSTRGFHAPPSTGDLGRPVSSLDRARARAVTGGDDGA